MPNDSMWSPFYDLSVHSLLPPCVSVSFSLALSSSLPFSFLRHRVLSFPLSFALSIFIPNFTRAARLCSPLARFYLAPTSFLGQVCVGAFDRKAPPADRAESRDDPTRFRRVSRKFRVRSEGHFRAIRSRRALSEVCTVYNIEIPPARSSPLRYRDRRVAGLF